MSTRALILVALAFAGAGCAATHAAPAPTGSKASTDAEGNRRAGEAFLAENAAREGVVTLPSGLQYEILKAGEGKKPTLVDTVVVHYRGTLVDGTEFGNSYKAGKPGAFPLRAAIAGWREALPLMPTGSRWRLVVPPHLAYGARGAGAIGPNATTVFEAELVSVKEGKRVPSPGIEVSFKLDPQITRGLYMGDRWVSAPTFTAPSQGKTATVEASAHVVDATGKRVAVAPEWTPADREMVEVTRSKGNEFKITVKRPGESKLVVAFGRLTKELSVKASERGEAIAVEISQAERGSP